jgi:putative DNA primase/helicase
MLSYSLTGSIRDHALFFLYGTGGNGKGVFLNTWASILGDYAKVAAMETFTVSHGDRHPTDLAMLRGARAVIAQETEEGQRWAESRIKALTGGDPISARFMRQDFFTFTPAFKLMIAGNHKPSLRSVDEAVKRRFNLVPFTVTIPKAERDPKLPEKLVAEWPGILAWAIEGCLEWQHIGLSPPPAVQAATASYLADEDTIGLFLAERCATDDPNASTESKTSSRRGRNGRRAPASSPARSNAFRPRSRPEASNAAMIRSRAGR